MKIFYTILTVFLISLQTFANEPKIPVKLVKIIDGDTIIASIDKNQFYIRLYAIDCFETNKINRAYKQGYENNISIEDVIELGNYSKKYLINLYKRSNKNTYFTFMGVDYYKRILGIVYFDELNVNNEMNLNGGCMGI